MVKKNLMNNIKTLKELRASGYVSKSIKDEMRDNLVKSIRNKENVFKGIIGFEDSVIPDIERAILSRHNINLLGLRGQAKTRIARQLTELLDEYIPLDRLVIQSFDFRVLSTGMKNIRRSG